MDNEGKQDGALRQGRSCFEKAHRNIGQFNHAHRGRLRSSVYPALVAYTVGTSGDKRPEDRAPKSGNLVAPELWSHGQAFSEPMVEASVSKVGDDD